MNQWARMSDFETGCPTSRHTVWSWDILHTYYTITTGKSKSFCTCEWQQQNYQKSLWNRNSKWSWWFNFRSLLATDCRDKTWVSLHAILLRASWQWSCVKYVSRSDSMSQSWTACLKVGRSANWCSWQELREHACNLVTGVLGVILCGVCLKIRQYVSKLDNLSQS